MAKIPGGKLIVPMMLALLFLDNVTALSDILPEKGYSSYIDEQDMERFGNSYPVITVELLPGNRINATQRRLNIDPPIIPHFILQYHPDVVYLNYQTKGGNYGRVLMNETESVVFDVALNSRDDWILFNYDYSATCRVIYDDILWNRITKQLSDNHTEFSEQTRWRLFDDARNLAKEGQIGYDRVLQLISLANKDRIFVLWFRIVDFVNYFRRMVYGTDVYSDFQRFMLNVIKPIMDDNILGREPRNLFEGYNHQKIWSLSCSLDHKGCIVNATRAFKNWVKLDWVKLENWVKLETREYGFGYYTDHCTGMANSFLESEWNTIFERVKLLPTTYMFWDGRGRDLVHILSCSRNATLLERLLDYITENANKYYWDRIYPTMSYMNSRPESNYTSWKWMKLNSAKVDERSRSPVVNWYLKSLAYYLKTREQRQEVVDFLANYPHADPDHTSQILHIIDVNIRWMDKNLAAIGQWLRENEYFGKKPHEHATTSLIIIDSK